MLLLTKEITDRLPKLYATENVPTPEKKIVVKFFNPCAAQTWYIVEGEPVQVDDGSENGVLDYQFFGWCDLGFGPGCSELGYVMLSELAEYKGRFGLGIERDMHYGYDHTLAEVME